MDDIRVISVGIDIVMKDNMTLSDIKETLYNVFNGRDGFRVAVADFKEDVTDLYKHDYQEELCL